MSEERAARRRRLRAGLEPAVGQVVREATRRLAEQTARAARTRGDVDRLMEQVGHLGREQRAGHLFELMHADGFNRQAIARGAQVRAVVNGLNGAPHAAADIAIVGSEGVIREAQAKLFESSARSATRQASAKYRGQVRLVAEDQCSRARAFYDDRLAKHPDLPRALEWEDARTHLADRLGANDIEGDPVSRGETLRVADHPQQWADRRWAREAGRQVGTAALTGAATGAVLSGVLEAVTQVDAVRSGRTTVTAASREVLRSALEGGARNGAVSGLGAALEVAATRGGLAAAVVGKVPVGAAASAIVGVTESALAFARGKIDGREFALRACESTFITGVSWAGGVLGAGAVPVVGGLAGGLAAQWCATLIAQGIRSALETARDGDVDAERIAQLSLEAGAAAETAQVLALETRALGEGADVLASAVVVPALEAALAAEDPAAGLELVDDVFRTFAGTPIFGTLEEFDAWLADADAVLVLDPNVLLHTR